MSVMMADWLSRSGVFALTFLLSSGAFAQPSGKRAEMWEAYQASRPIAERAWMAAVMGYELAVLAEAKAANKANIAEERQSARRGGGVVDLAALHAYQERIREAEEETARIKSLAKSMGIRPAKAASPAVESVAKCVSPGVNDSLLRDEQAFSKEDAEAGTCFWLYLFHCEVSGDGESVRGWKAERFGAAAR